MSIVDIKEELLDDAYELMNENKYAALGLIATLISLPLFAYGVGDDNPPIALVGLGGVIISIVLSCIGIFNDANNIDKNPENN